MRRPSFFIFIYLIPAFCLIISIFCSASFSADKDRYLLLGIADYKDENYEEAAYSLLKALNENPRSSVAAYYAGLAYKEMLDYEKAGLYLERALEIDQSMGKAWLNLGEVLYRQERFKEAELSLGKAEALGTLPVYRLYLQGLVSLKMGDYDDAIDRFNLLISQDPAYRQTATYLIGRARLAVGDDGEAAGLFREAISIAPGTPVAVKAAKRLKDLRNRPEEKNLSLFFAYSYQYDNNVLLKPSEEIPGVSITDEADYRHAVNINVIFRTGSDKPVYLRAAYSFYQSFYQELSEFNMQGHSVRLTPAVNMDKGEISLLAGSDYFYLDNIDYLQVFRVRPAMRLALGNGHRLTLFADLLSRDFIKDASSPDEDRDAENFGGGFNYTVLTNNNGYLSLGYAYESEDAKGKNWDYTGGRLNLIIVYALGSAAHLRFTGRYAYQDYGNLHSFYRVKRTDSLISIAPALSFRLNDLTVSLKVSFSNNSSTIKVYDYSRNIASIGLNYVY